MIALLNEVSNALLLISPTRKDIPKPFVAVGGIDSKSALNSLPAFFPTYPIYHITGENKFTVEIHTDKIKLYSGPNNL
jgi:hypothetical protein